jgi:hypothetical protein
VHRGCKYRSVAPFHPGHPGLRMKELERNSPPLPYTVPPFSGELLSSWLTRIAADYRISLAQLCRHLGLSAVTSPITDKGLKEADIRRVAASTRSTADDIRRMIRQPVQRSSINLVAGRAPIQFCRNCRALHAGATAEPVGIMSWFEFWQIECLECRLPFSTNVKPDLPWSDPARDYPEWFSKLLPVARKGGRRLEVFARCPIGRQLAPVAVLNLLSIPLRRRLVGYRSSYDRNWGQYHRTAELFVPGLRTLSSEHQLIPKAWTSRKPVRLVTARAILLAAMAAFFVNVRHSFRRVTETAFGGTLASVRRWFNALPWTSRTILSASF